MAAHPRARYIGPMATLPLPPAQPADDLWDDLIEGILNDDGAAAREHLAAGFPIYWSEDGAPPGVLIKEHPDGRRESIRLQIRDNQALEVLA